VAIIYNPDPKMNIVPFPYIELSFVSWYMYLSSIGPTADANDESE